MLRCAFIIGDALCGHDPLPDYWLSTNSNTNRLPRVSPRSMVIIDPIPQAVIRARQACEIRTR